MLTKYIVFSNLNGNTLQRPLMGRFFMPAKLASKLRLDLLNLSASAAVPVCGSCASGNGAEICAPPLFYSKKPLKPRFGEVNSFLGGVFYE